MANHNQDVPLLAVCAESNLSEDLLLQARTFASQYELPFYQEQLADQARYVVHFSKGQISLCQTGKGAPGPITASFLSGKSLHRLRHGGGSGQLVAKAVGLNKGIKPHVLDVTAGLGRDAFVLASLGCQVDMFERVPVVELLLQHAVQQAQMSAEPEVAEAALRMHLRFGNAIEFLNSAPEPVADIIYLDPMYPTREKSAAVKKEMRAFHDIVGENKDDAELLEAALKKARYRVVVKRPRKGDEIRGKKPSLKLEGKSSRYDIYTLRKLEART